MATGPAASESGDGGVARESIRNAAPSSQDSPGHCGPTVTANPMDQVVLDPGERALHGWPVEMVLNPSSKVVAGWLLLTSRRCLFFRRAGLFGGGRLLKPPTFIAKLEEIHSVSARQFAMLVGYGEQIPIPGLEVDGQEFKLNRETPSAPVVAEIAEARSARDAESGRSSR